MVVNESGLVNATGFDEVLQGINIASGNMLAPLLIMIIFLVAFISLKNYDTKVGLMASSLITLFISVFFFWIGWTSWHMIIYPIFGLNISGVWMAADS